MMVRIVTIVTVLTYLCYGANGFQEIRLPKLPLQLRNQNSERIFFILFSEPLQIVFENRNLLTVQCFNEERQEIFKPLYGSNFFPNENTVLKISDVSTDMKTKWNCMAVDTVKTQYSFEIRNKEDAIVVTINRNFVNFTMTNNPGNEYGGINEYDCEEGETIDLTCSNGAYSDGSLILRYNNANGTKIFEIDEVFKTKKYEAATSMRILMRGETNGSFVDCTYFTAPNRYNIRSNVTYRIIFNIRKEISKDNFFSITVNDKKLTSHKPDADVYNYNFVYGENLTVTCEMKNKIISTEIGMGIEAGRARVLTKDIEKSDSKYRFFLETTHLDGAYVECSTFLIETRQFVKALINFSVQPYNGPSIIGLPASDVLYQYGNNDKEWIAHYLYTPNVAVVLTCICTCKRQTLRWYVGDKMIGGTKGQNKQIGITYIRDKFILDQKNITCQLVEGISSRTSSWVLVLHEKVHSQPLDKPLDDNKDGKSSYILVIIGCTAGGLLGILMTAFFTFYWYRKHAIYREKPFTKFNENDNPNPPGDANCGNNQYTYITNEYNYIKSEDSVIVANSLYYGPMPQNTESHRRDTTNTEDFYTEIYDNYNSGKEKNKRNSAVGHTCSKYENLESSYSNL